MKEFDSMRDLIFSKKEQKLELSSLESKKTQSYQAQCHENRPRVIMPSVVKRNLLSYSQVPKEKM